MPGCDALWRHSASVEKRILTCDEAAGDSQEKQPRLMEGSFRASQGKRDRFCVEAPYKKDKEVKSVNRRRAAVRER